MLEVTVPYKQQVWARQRPGELVVQIRAISALAQGEVIVAYHFIGSRMIVGVIHQTQGAQLTAVASRRQARPDKLAQEHNMPTVYAGWQQLIQADDIDVVYVAAPTAGLEEICLAAMQQGKHLISEKPFICAYSARRIAALAQAKGR